MAHNNQNLYRTLSLTRRASRSAVHVIHTVFARGECSDSLTITRCTFDKISENSHRSTTFALSGTHGRPRQGITHISSSVLQTAVHLCSIFQGAHDRPSTWSYCCYLGVPSGLLDERYRNDIGSVDERTHCHLTIWVQEEVGASKAWADDYSS